MGIVEGKVAIVTGGTRGIGFTIVREFLKNGAKVALAGSRQETVDAALAKLAEEGFTDNVMGIAPSLTDPDSVAAAFASVVDRFGRLDVLCNNAGVSSRTPLVDYTLEEFNKVMSINVTAVFVCTQAAARIMIEQGEGGSIVNTSSMVGKYGQPSGFAYPTSKFAVNGLTLSLARELAKHKIRVNAVAPGVTHTDMVDALPDSVIKPLIESIPLGRMGEPEDILCLSVPGQRYVQLRVGRRASRRRPVAPVSTSQSHTERPPSFKGRRPFSCICSSKHPHKQYSAFYASCLFS